MVIISLCEADGGDTTCSLPGSIDPNGDVEITVINIGNDVSNNDQFSCLVNGGTSSPNYNEYNTPNDAMNDAEHLEEEICERPTPRPTLRPTPKPTFRPTPKPTPRPSPRPV